MLEKGPKENLMSAKVSYPRSPVLQGRQYSRGSKVPKRTSCLSRLVLCLHNSSRLPGLY